MQTFSDLDRGKDDLKRTDSSSSFWGSVATRGPVEEEDMAYVKR